MINEHLTLINEKISLLNEVLNNRSLSFSDNLEELLSSPH